VTARPFLILFAVLLMSDLALASESSQKLPQRPRYVSSQAYYHAMRAELALAQSDLATAASEYQLALVYDSDSPYLTLQLAWVSLKLGAVAKAEKLADRALTLDATNADAFLVKSRAELAKGQTAAAERALRRALEVSPNSVDAAVELARLLSKMGKKAEAIGVLDKAAERSPEATEPLAQIAEIEVDRRRLGAAAHALESALTRDPRSVSLMTALSSIYERLARWDDAVKRWRDFIELMPSDPDALLSAARAEMWVDRDDLADQDVEAIQAMIRGPELDQRLGLLYLSEGRADKALPLLLEAQRALPSDQRVRFAYATALFASGKEEASLAELELIGPGDELYPEARVRIGNVLLQSGRFDRALASVRTALERSPKSPPLIVFLATLQERMGKAEEALKTIREGRKLLAAEHDVMGDLELAEAEAQTLLRSGDRDRGIRVLRSVVDAPGVQSEDALSRLASLYERAGEYEAAVETAQRIIRESPDSSRALNFLGYLWADKAVHLDEADKLLHRALVADPRSGAILDSLGWLTYRQGKLDLAERLVHRAAKLTDGDAEVMEHLGDIQHQRGEKDRAKASWMASKDAYARLVKAREPDAKKAMSRIENKLGDLGRGK
jgi:tetratricopeptide (TPR) repeat protein